MTLREIIARKLCEQAGSNPDQPIEFSNNDPRTCIAIRWLWEEWLPVVDTVHRETRNFEGRDETGA